MSERACAKGKTRDEMIELLRAMLIVQLGLADVYRTDIRKIAGCDMNRVNAILKPVLRAKKMLIRSDSDA